MKYLALPVSSHRSTSGFSMFAPNILIFEKDAVSLKVWSKKREHVAFSLSMKDIKNFQLTTQKLVITATNGNVYKMYITVSGTMFLKFPPTFNEYMKKNENQYLTPNYWMQYKRTFFSLNRFDRYSSGTVSKEELEKILKPTGKLLSETQGSKIWRLFNNYQWQTRLIIIILTILIMAIISYW